MIPSSTTQESLSPPRFQARLALSNLVWNQHLIGTKLQFSKERKNRDANSCLKKNGWYIGEISKNTLNNLNNLFKKENNILFQFDDYFNNYYYNISVDSNYQNLLNENYKFFNPDRESLAALSESMAEIEEELTDLMEHHWQIVNIRCIESNENTNFGQMQFHRDNFAGGMLKFIFYLSPPNYQNGTTEIIDYNEKMVAIESDKPSWVIFDAPNLEHRGRPSKGKPRRTVELTITPAFETSREIIVAGLNAIHPWLPPEMEAGEKDIRYLQAHPEFSFDACGESYGGYREFHAAYIEAVKEAQIRAQAKSA